MRHNSFMQMYRYLIALFIVVFSHSVLAESWYQVEVVVFDRLYPELDGEQWQGMEFEPRSNLLKLLPNEDAVDGTELVPFSLLPASKNRLNGVYRAFKLSEEYRPLLHYSWQQPATERRQSRFVHIQKLEGEGTVPTFEAELPEVEATVIETEPETEPDFIEALIEPELPEPIVDGAIRIRSGFYLHVDVDLTYFNALPAENRMVRTADELQQDPFMKLPIKLKETRKIKLNEIHYFDHPMFGLIIQVSRLNQP